MKPTTLVRAFEDGSKSLFFSIELAHNELQMFFSFDTDTEIENPNNLNQ